MTPDPKPLRGLAMSACRPRLPIVSGGRQIDCAPSGKVRVSSCGAQPRTGPLLVSLRAPLSDVVISDNENQVL